MPWEGQQPAANEVLARVRIETSDELAYIEVDRYYDEGSIPLYRATIGNLFVWEKLAVVHDLPVLLKAIYVTQYASNLVQVQAGLKAIRNMDLEKDL